MISLITWVLLLWGAFIALVKLDQYHLIQLSANNVFQYLGYFIVIKIIFSAVLRQTISLMRTRDWLRQRKWERQKMEMEQQYYHQKHQEFLKQQELKRIKDIDYEAGR